MQKAPDFPPPVALKQSTSNLARTRSSCTRQSPYFQRDNLLDYFVRRIPSDGGSTCARQKDYNWWEQTGTFFSGKAGSAREFWQLKLLTAAQQCLIRWNFLVVQPPCTETVIKIRLSMPYVSYTVRPIHFFGRSWCSRSIFATPNSHPMTRMATSQTLYLESELDGVCTMTDESRGPLASKISAEFMRNRIPARLSIEGLIDGRYLVY
jgi:hypothetical protein